MLERWRRDAPTDIEHIWTLNTQLYRAFAAEHLSIRCEINYTNLCAVTRATDGLRGDEDAGSSSSIITLFKSFLFTLKSLRLVHFTHSFNVFFLSPISARRALPTMQVSVDSDKGITTTTWRTNSFHHRHHHHGTQKYQVSHSTNNVLRARRGVIRMLIIVVLTFAVCNLPFHARKMWQYW